MNSSTTTCAIPLMWPNSGRLAGAACAVPDVATLFHACKLLMGVVHGLTQVGIGKLEAMLKAKAEGNGDGEAAGVERGQKARLIVVLSPICPTDAETLRALLALQDANVGLEVRLMTCDLLAQPQSIVACYPTAEALPTMLIGPSGGLEGLDDAPERLTIGFKPDPTLATEWARWFDVRWLGAMPLTEDRTAIPHLVLPEGTVEAAEQWDSYQRKLAFGQENEEAATVTIDPATGEITAKAADGTTIATVSAENKIPKVSPIHGKLASLLEEGHLVSIDKSTRLPPLEVSVKPDWFGLKTLTQIGAVKRQVSYHVSPLTDEELRSLENRRKKTGELLDLFSFSLADGQRWMPTTAETLFQQEMKRINEEAAAILNKLIAGDLGGFLTARREAVRKDAQRMLHDLFPERKLSEQALDEIMGDLKSRFEKAQTRSFLPKLAFSTISLPQPQTAEWKSQFGTALHLLLSIVRYPRKACQSGMYFGRGVKAKPDDILKAMDVLADPFVSQFASSQAATRAEEELALIQNIEGSENPAERKCERLLKLASGDLSLEASSDGGT